jgi:acetate---CoA ligase (ADP-forming)
VSAASDVLLCGPNCLGLVNLYDRIPIGPLPDKYVPGPIGAVLQSGVLVSAITDPLIERGIGLSFVVSSGNEAVVETADYIDFLVDDPNTEVIVAFIEGLKDPDAFMRAAARALRVGKPIVALKVGRSERGRAAAVAHTGSLAGSDQAHDAVFREFGVVRVDDIDEMVETALLLAGGRRPRGNRLAIATFSGGGCGLLSDEAARLGLEFAPLSPETVQQLRRRLPPYATVSNPLDLTGTATDDPQLYPDCLSILVNAEEVDVLGVSIASGLGSGGADLYRRRSAVLAEAGGMTEKVLLGFNFSSGGFDGAIADTMAKAGVPLLQGARETLLAVDRLFWYTRRMESGVAPRESGVSPRQSAAESLLEGRSGALTERESKELLALYGLPVTREQVARTAQEAAEIAGELGFPVVLKIESPDILHKTDVGGVRVGLLSEAEVRSGFDAIVNNVKTAAPTARIRGVLVQEQVPPGMELILGVHRDEQFGPLALVGIGGILVEMLRQFSVRRVPISRSDAEEMIETLPGGRILGSVRGQPARDVPAIVDALLALSALAVDLGPRLVSLDINPAIVGAKSEGLKAVDGLVVLE